MKYFAFILLGILVGSGATSAFYSIKLKEEEKAGMKSVQLFTGAYNLAYLMFLEEERYDELKGAISDRLASYYADYHDYKPKGESDEAFSILAEKIDKARNRSSILDTKMTNKTIESTP